MPIMENIQDKGYIEKYYVIDDLNARQFDIKYYSDYSEALSNYTQLPSDRKKTFGIQNSRGSCLDFIQCCDEKDTFIKDFEKVPGWDNPEIKEITEKIMKDICECNQEIKRIENIFAALPISKSEWMQTTGEDMNSNMNMDFIIEKWNQCNEEDGKYLVNTKDFGIEFGLKRHTLQKEPIEYEVLKHCMEKYEALKSCMEEMNELMEEQGLEL